MEHEPRTKNEFNAVTKKILMIVGLTLGLMIPLLQVENQIRNRQSYETLALNQVAKGWGQNVSIASPVLKTEHGGIDPITAETSIHVASKEKKRGLFRVPVYNVTYRTKVSFLKPKIETPTAMNPPKSANPTSKDPIPNPKEPDSVRLYIDPISSLQKIRIIEVASGQEIKFKLTDDGVRILATDLPGRDFFASQLEIELTSKGTGPLRYSSYSELETVKMVGNWKKPKFVDELLPDETKMTKDGFEASWSLSSLAIDRQKGKNSIGLEHLWVGTDYSMTERAVKYGLLFIALTFLLVFIVEFLSKIKIHPLQYGLIGLSISVFYLLLLALSETVGFDLAYLMSSLAVSSLIGFYVAGFIRQKKFVKMILGEQILLSAFFYLLLSLEDSALLIGSLGLFAALTAFMICTRHFDWYLGRAQSQEPTKEAL